MFQEPTQPLPYLFLYSSEQNTGKSILHEALRLLFTRGYSLANAAIENQAGYNAELAGAVLCVIEEVDLKKNKTAYNRIKDWVTSRELLIHAKYQTPFHTPNTSHWVHCANNHQYCPVFTGDTRITMMYVKPLDPLELIPKRKMIENLEKEAPHFLAEILNLELPESNDRLNIPALESSDKSAVERLNQSDLESFIQEKCQHAPGYLIKFSDFYERFLHYLDPSEVSNWSKIKVGREIPPQYPKARHTKDSQRYIGNLAWGEDNVDEERKPLEVRGDFLRETVG